MKYLIEFAGQAYYAGERGEEPPAVGKGIGLALGIFALQFSSSFCFNQFVYRGMTVGGQSRAALIAMIFAKSMRISSKAKAGGLIKEKGEEEHANQEEDEKGGKKKKNKKEKKAKKPGMGEGAGWTNGRVVNLMGTDTYRVDQAASWFHIIWTAPVLVLVTVALLIINLTYSALAGLAVLVCGVPLLGMVIRSLANRRTKMNRITDARVSLMQEVLLGVKFVKYYAWEKSFLKHLDALRAKEIHAVQVMLAIRSAVNAVGIVSVSCFILLRIFIAISNYEV